MQGWDGALIEEAVTWKSCQMQTGAEGSDGVVVQEALTVKQGATRIGPERDVFLIRLNSVMNCPVGAISLLLVVHTDMDSVMRNITSGNADKMYMFHQPGNFFQSLTAKSIKRQIVKALAKMDIDVELYEVQSLIDATHARIGAEKYNCKVSAAHTYHTY